MSRGWKIATYLLLVLFGFLFFFPILFSLCASFVPKVEIANGNYFPDSFYLDNYINAFRTQPLLHYMKNTIIVASISTVLKVIVSLFGAYAIVFIDFKGRNLIFLIFMATMMIPQEILIISNFNTIKNWHLLNTYAGLILPGLASTFGIFLLRQNLKQIPWEMKEASEIAGISDFQFFLKIAVPMVKNSIITLAIYNFLVSWNSYLWPLLSTTEDKVRTVQIGLRQLKNVDGISDLGMVAAGAIIVSIPTLILLFFGQKRLQEGLSKGALK